MWFNKNKKSAIVVPEQPQVFSQPVKSGNRQGMWVKLPDGSVGILTKPDENKVTVIKPDGHTKMVLNEQDVPTPMEIQAEAFRQAYIEEIPNSRCPDVHVLFALGYTHGGAA